MVAREVPTDAAGVETAAAALQRGAAIIIPTDTVYGIAVLPTVAGAPDRLFAAKDRGRDVPVAVLVADAEQAWAVAASPVPASAVRLAARHWPGAVTLVVPRDTGWTADLGDERATVGLRCPDHAWVRALCRRVGPIATSSANLHGEATPVLAAAAAAVFGDRVGLVVDGGELRGVASTVVSCPRDGAPAVLRQGAVAIG